MDIRIKRVYEASAPEDGTRVLVDRLWPRGLTKKEARVDLWLKEIAPSTELRHWFSHDPSRWKEFQSRYLIELGSKDKEAALIKERLSHGRMTLVYGARDVEHNHALVLCEWLSRR